MINIRIKKKIGDVVVYLETAAENKEIARKEFKDLYELLSSTQKELLPESEKSSTSSNKFSYMKG